MSRLWVEIEKEAKEIKKIEGEGKWKRQKERKKHAARIEIVNYILLKAFFWRRKWQPTPVLLPWKSHGRRSLVQATVHGVAKSRARLSNFTFTFTKGFLSNYCSRLLKLAYGVSPIGLNSKVKIWIFLKSQRTISYELKVSYNLKTTIKF